MSAADPFVMQTYARYPLTLVEGRGCRVRDDGGREYLDFISGIAVNSLGHAHPDLARALCEQAGRMLHCSNLFHIASQAELAERLCRLAGLDRAFFANSGAEANEAAIKLARKYWFDRKSPQRDIVTAARSFHGRTMTTLTATGQEKVKQGFDPLPPGFRHVDYGDVGPLAEAVDEKTAAVMLEPVQGEGGVHRPPEGYLAEVRRLCDERGTLLILDEIQTGVGRTGTMFAFEHEGMRPDILTLAKGLGGGAPIGATLATEEIAAAFGPGSHGSTFGGNPLSTRAALAVLDVIEREGLLENARRQGERLRAGLEALGKRFPAIEAVRGQGLIAGAALTVEAAPIITAARARGLLILPAGPKVLRFLPPLNVTAAEIDEALEKLEAGLRDASAERTT